MTLTRPDLHVAVAGQKSKASEYNENFEMMLDYCDEVVEECEEKKQELIDTAESYMPTLSAGAMYSDGSSSFYSAGEHFAINKGSDPLLNAPGSGTVIENTPITFDNLSTFGTYTGTGFNGTATNPSTPTWVFDSDYTVHIDTVTYYTRGYSEGNCYGSNFLLEIKQNGSWVSKGTFGSGQFGGDTSSTITIDEDCQGIRATTTGAVYSSTVWGLTALSGTKSRTVSVSTADILYFNINKTNKLTFTNVIGKSKTIEALNIIDVSDISNGTYKVSIPYNNLNPYLVTDKQIFIQSMTPYKEYTKVGSPTILGDTISGFSSANYLTLNNTFNPDSRNWKITIAFTVGTDITTSQVLYSDGVQDTSMAMEFGLDGGYFKYSLSSNGTSYDIANNVSAFTLTASTSYIVELSFNGIGYSIKYTVDDSDTWTTGTGTISSSVLYTAPTSYIGCRRATDKAFSGSIDWANTEFRVKDNIHITPQKPHTAFKDTLTDREAFNDVIPVGAQITVASGLITKLSQPYYNANSLDYKTIDLYKSGASFYEISTTTNGVYCRQGGNGSGTITLLKEFKDTNYIVTSTATASNKAVGSFTLSATADWIAEGYIL